MDKGIENTREITDEQIEKMEDNGLMTQRFVQSLVRCARRICILRMEMKNKNETGFDRCI